MWPAGSNSPGFCLTRLAPSSAQYGVVEHVTSADSCAIAVERSGHGPPVVFVNGAFSTRASGAPLATLLDDEFTVYRYDRRGRGDSEDTDAYAVEREVEDLDAVIAAAGGRAVVFGHSSGAALSLETAAAGVGVAGLLVHEPPYVPGPSTSSKTADEFAALVAAGRGEEVAERFLRNTGMPVEVVAQAKAGPGWPAMVAMAHTLPYEVRLCNLGVVPVERLRRISCPVLATAGSLSPAWAVEAAQTIAGAVPDGGWRLLDGQAHNVAPDVLASLIRERFRG
jgi:pimeloyl-ACP methyl ester carboxylesterase